MNGKVLVAENKDEIRSLLKICLENNYYTVIEAKDGEEALSLIRKHRIDVLVLDILMPKITGLEVCKIIRKDSSYRSLPIIFLSGLNQKKMIIEGLEAGGDDYMTKPFDPNELVARMNAILRRTRGKGKENMMLYEKLTMQERKVLQLMEQGYTNKEIALKLYLTEGTIKVYSHHIYQKLQVKNRMHAIVRAKEAELI